MLTSLELRWFYPGELPQEISLWFEQDELEGQLQSPEEREDVYLYTPGCEYLGIKLRQGRLEVKWRQAELGIVHFGCQVKGRLEKWSKWLCEGPTAESFQTEAVMGQKTWVSVKKARSQRLYDSCALELTQLRIKDKDWWSLAFETTGSDANVADKLQFLATQVFKTYSGSKLQAQDSYGYPHWLDVVS
jgi:hypothetical protein